MEYVCTCSESCVIEQFEDVISNLRKRNQVLEVLCGLENNVEILEACSNIQVFYRNRIIEKQKKLQ